MANKTVLITGSSKGLGASLALEYSRNEYDVILHGRNEQRLAEVQSSVLNNGVECEAVIGDITSDETLGRLAEIAEKRNVDVVVNNAAVYLNQSFSEMDINDFRDVIEVNLLAPVRLIKKMLPVFQSKKTGLIININSVAGNVSSAGESAYASSKHGLRGFSKSLQFDATKIGVSLIDVYLGAMQTQMTSDRPNSEMFIVPSEAADTIVRLSRDYRSMKITEINIGRRRY
jgi:short-subunit dehydrogenase